MEHFTSIYLIPFITLILGSYFTYILSTNEKIKSEQRQYKEAKYAALLLSIKAFCGENATTMGKKQFFDEYYQSWLYASDEVIVAIKTMVDAIKNKPAEDTIVPHGKLLIGNIVKAIRKDMKVNSKLSADSFEYIDVHPSPLDKRKIK